MPSGSLHALSCFAELLPGHVLTFAGQASNVHFSPASPILISINSALLITSRACAGQHVHCAGQKGQVSAVQWLYDRLLVVLGKGLTEEL